MGQLSIFKSAVAVAFVSAAFCGGVNGTLIYTANLTHGQEPSPGGTTPTTNSDGSPRPLPFGTATFTLNDASNVLTMTATVFNIDFTGSQTVDTNDNLTNAHLHAPGLPGVTGPVVWGFFGAPFNDNNPNQFVMTPFAAGVGGTVSGTWDAPEGNGTTLAAQLTNLQSGQMYIDFHTVQFPAGEIRGQIVPEPTGFAVAGVAAPGLLVRRRRCRIGTRTAI